MNIEETKFMQRILGNDYICEPRENGVHCYSETGIADTFTNEEIERGQNDHWDIIMKAIRQEFKERFLEVFSQTSTKHKKFTVFIKPHHT